MLQFWSGYTFYTGEISEKTFLNIEGIDQSWTWSHVRSYWVFQTAKATQMATRDNHFYRYDLLPCIVRTFKAKVVICRGPQGESVWSEFPPQIAKQNGFFIKETPEGLGDFLKDGRVARRHETKLFFAAKIAVKSWKFVVSRDLWWEELRQNKDKRCLLLSITFWGRNFKVTDSQCLCRGKEEMKEEDCFSVFSVRAIIATLFLLLVLAILGLYTVPTKYTLSREKIEKKPTSCTGICNVFWIKKVWLLYSTRKHGQVAKYSHFFDFFIRRCWNRV